MSSTGFTEESFKRFCDKALGDLPPINKNVEWERQRGVALGHQLRKLRRHLGADDTASVDPGRDSVVDR